MAKGICGFTLLAVFVCLMTPKCAAGQHLAPEVQKQQERDTVSLELEISRRKESPIESTISFLFGADPNGYATGFLVGDGLVMTAYHVVSGELSDAKKMNLGFKLNDQLSVKVFVNGCHAKVIMVDKDADLALLELCGSTKKTKAPAFQAAPKKDEKVFLIARLKDSKRVSHGIFSGSYTFRGHEYWSAKIDRHDGCSGSPVYNHKAELVGVFSRYDWSQKIAVISPGLRAQKLLEDYAAKSGALKSRS